MAVKRLVFGAMVCPANIGERAGAMRLLESVKIAQVEGKIQTKEEAIAFIKAIL